VGAVVKLLRERYVSTRTPPPRPSGGEAGRSTGVGPKPDESSNEQVDSIRIRQALADITTPASVMDNDRNDLA
jgi:hypothetical protein